MILLPRKVISTFATFLLVVLTSIVSSTPAQAAPTGNLTIVSSGGAAENSGWTYSSGVIEVTSNVSINASDIVSKLASSNLIVSANSILVNADIVSNTARNLTLQSVGNIIISGAYDVITQGGDITFQSNSTDSGSGSIRLGNIADNSTGLIDSNGGNITFSGGTNVLTGYAMASADFLSSKPAAGVAGYGFNVQADGGAILVRGSSTANAGRSTRAVYFENNAAGRQVLQTSGAGALTVIGDGSAITHSNAWGINVLGADFITGSGDIQFTGKGNVASTNIRGIVSGNATYQSTSGDITLEDITTGPLNTYPGTYFGAPNSFSTAGNVLIAADSFRNDSTLTFVTPSAVIESYTGVSFVTPLSILSTIVATNCSNLRIGKPGNTAAVTLTNAITVGGPFSIYGGNILLNGAVSVPSSNVSLIASGNVTQAAAITSDGLVLSGTGNFTLNNASNNVRIMAGGSSGTRLGNVIYTDASGGLAIGQIGSISGMFTTGELNIATYSGNLTIQQTVSSSGVSGDNVELYADQNESSGNAGDGNIIFSGSGEVSIPGTARALLYSGVRATSTGLVTEVGGEQNARSLVDATTVLSSITPALGSTGMYALFRTTTPAPTYTITYSGNQSTGGSAPTATSGSYSQTVEANSGNLERTGFTFSGWNTQADGNGTNYASGDSITPTSNITLYAKWVAVPAPTPSPTPTPGPTVSPASLPLTGVNLEPAMVGAVFTLTLGIVLAALAGLRRKK